MWQKLHLNTGSWTSAHLEINMSKSPGIDNTMIITIL